MVLVLNKIIIAALLLFCFDAIAQQNEVALLVIESQPVVKSKLCNVYNTLSKQDLGETTTLNFELLTVKETSDSIAIEFNLWFCPYFAEVDNEQRMKDCPCNDLHFTYYIVSVKQSAKHKIGEKVIKGKYKVIESSPSQFCVNEVHTIKLEKANNYDLIFKLDNGKAIYIKIG